MPGIVSGIEHFYIILSEGSYDNSYANDSKGKENIFLGNWQECDDKS